jgi:hypothetical protein
MYVVIFINVEPGVARQSSSDSRKMELNYLQ